MAYFTKKTWKDRLVEFAGRRTLKNVGTNESVTYDVTRAEGTVSQEGDAFSPANMNDMEQRIADGFSAAEAANNQLSSERNIFSRSFNYTELISGSENYSAGYVIIAKVNRVVIANVDVYFKTGLTPGVAHQILSKSQLVDINCWIPTPTGNQSYAFESIAISGVNKNLAIIGLNGSDNAANGLTIYPLDVPTGVGDHIRHQLIWVSE